jgi:hypothetical protein
MDENKSSGRFIFGAWQRECYCQKWFVVARGNPVDKIAIIINLPVALFTPQTLSE